MARSQPETQAAWQLSVASGTAGGEAGELNSGIWQLNISGAKENRRQPQSILAYRESQSSAV